MTLRQISTKIDLRLNKSASGDFDNIWPYVKQEAFNKGVNDWVRRQKRGKNQTQEQDEETDTLVDDLQFLLTPAVLAVRNKGLYGETTKLPSDYRYFKRLTPIVSKGNCQGVQIKSHLREEANVDELVTTLPSFNFEETFHTLMGNKAHIYHNNDFTIDKANLTYYRSPTVYDFKRLDTVVEFKDDVCEILVEEAVDIIAGDIESVGQKQIAEQKIEKQ